MVLANPVPITATNYQNQLTFKQIQTEDYDLAKTQKNIQDVILAITQALNASVITIASQPTQTVYALTTAPITLQFPNVELDTVQAYTAVTSSYRAPNAGGFQTLLNCYFTSVVTSTIITVLLVSNIQGNVGIAKQTVNADATVALNISAPLYLENNEVITPVVLADVAGTANLDPISIISFSRLR